MEKVAQMQNSEGPSTGKALAVGLGAVGLAVFWPQISSLFSGGTNGTGGNTGGSSSNPPTFASDYAYRQWVSLKNSKGTEAAAEFAEYAINLTDQDQIYHYYLLVFNKYNSSGGGTEPYDNTVDRQELYDKLKGFTGWYWTYAAEEFYSLSANATSRSEVIAVYNQIVQKYQSGMPIDQYPVSGLSSLTLVSHDGGTKKFGDTWRCKYSFIHVGSGPSLVKSDVQIRFPSGIVKQDQSVPSRVIALGNNYTAKTYEKEVAGVFDSVAYTNLTDGEVGTLEINVTDESGVNVLPTLSIPNAYTFTKPSSTSTDPIREQIGDAWPYISGCGANYNGQGLWVKRNGIYYVYDYSGQLNSVPLGKMLPGDNISCFCLADCTIQSPSGTHSLKGNIYNYFIW